MEISISKYLLARLLADAAEMGAKKALESTGELKSSVSMTDAYKMYSRRTVDRWIKEGRIKPFRNTPNSNKKFLSRSTLEALDKVNVPALNLITIKSNHYATPTHDLH